MHLLLLLLFCLMPFNAYSAFKSDTDALAPEAVWNPQPLRDDITLPMPCDLSLALRPVGISSGALIRDKSFAMGINNAADSDRQIYERQFTGHVSAPFTLADLPRSWQTRLARGKKNIANDAWYFIGKYEISKAQWEAVMDCLDKEGNEIKTMCPKPGEKGGNAPITDISWFDTQEFLNKYNAWLVKNHASALPAFAGAKNIAFLRLPTEEEWEFAARGYPKVPAEWWADHDFFPIPEDKQLKDFVVNSQESALQAPAAIGSRLANPLGIHDMAGNVGEMVDGFFRMSIADMTNGQVARRLHGAAGGILAKGGSFRSEDGAVMPGSRDELPLYTANGPGKASDLGFRIALAALNIPNAQRLAELRKEAGKLASQPAAEIKGTTPLELTESMLAQAEGKLKHDLERLKVAMEDQEIAWEARDRKNSEQSLRSLLYQSETLRDFAFRYHLAWQQVDKIKDMLKRKLSEEEATRARQVLAEGEKNLSDYKLSLQMGANYYKSMLASLAGLNPSELQPLIEQARQEYGTGVFFDEHMRKSLDVLEKYLAVLRKRGSEALDTRTILRGILPEKHFKTLEL